jgi:hypothetical protein
MDTHHVPVWVLFRDEPYSAGSLLSPTGIDLFPKHGILREKRKTVGDGHGTGEGHYVDRGGYRGFLCTRTDASLSGTGLYIAQVLRAFCTV